MEALWLKRHKLSPFQSLKQVSMSLLRKMQSFHHSKLKLSSKILSEADYLIEAKAMELHGLIVLCSYGYYDGDPLHLYVLATTFDTPFRVNLLHTMFDDVILFLMELPQGLSFLNSTTIKKRQTLW